MPEDNPLIIRTARPGGWPASSAPTPASRAGRQTPYVGAAVFLHATTTRSRLEPIGSQHIYGLDGHPSGLPSLKELLTGRPRNSDHLIDAARGRQIVELVRGAEIRPSVANRKLGQSLLHPRAFAEGVGWQDFLAGAAMDTATVRRVRST